VDALVKRCNSVAKDTAFLARCILATVLSSVKKRDDRRIMLATDHLGLPKGELEVSFFFLSEL